MPFYLSAQSFRNTAYDTNGPMGECLFPMDENYEIIFSEIVNVDNSKAEEIKDAIKNYIDNYLKDNKVDKRKEKIEDWSFDYDLEHPVGKQEIAFEFYYTQMFSAFRDASKVKFKLNIQVREGRLKCKLYDFWTSRRMIHGEGKNGGPSNMIHWQRVNSLTKERNQYASKHDQNKRSVKEDLYDIDAQMQAENNLYKLEYATIMNFIEGLKNIMPVHANSQFDDFDDDVKTKTIKKDIQVLDVSSMSDQDLVKKGNNVYVTSLYLRHTSKLVYMNYRNRLQLINSNGYW